MRKNARREILVLCRSDSWRSVDYDKQTPAKLKRSINMESLRINFRNMETSDWIEKLVSSKANKLSRFSDRVLRCHVTITALGGDHHKGRAHEVHIDLSVPGKEFVVKNTQADSDPAKAIAIACEHAFDSAQRDLRQYMDIKRNRVKTHANRGEREVDNLDDFEESESAQALTGVSIDL
jgi:ribosome-associated translation inhibitor RaiA